MRPENKESSVKINDLRPIMKISAVTMKNIYAHGDDRISKGKTLCPLMRRFKPDNIAFGYGPR